MLLPVACVSFWTCYRYKKKCYERKTKLEKSKWQPRMDNPEILESSGTQDTGRRHMNKYNAEN